MVGHLKVANSFSMGPRQSNDGLVAQVPQPATYLRQNARQSDEISGEELLSSKSYRMVLGGFIMEKATGLVLASCPLTLRDDVHRGEESMADSDTNWGIICAMALPRHWGAIQLHVRAAILLKVSSRSTFKNLSVHKVQTQTAP